MKHSIGIIAAGLLAMAGGTIAGGVETVEYGGASPSATNGGVSTREIAAYGPSVGITPLAVSFVPAVELPSEDWSVAGLRIDLLVGRHRDMWGFDLGVIGGDIDHSGGGVQAAGIFSRCGSDFYGVQLAGIYDRTDGEIEGMQGALVNSASVLCGLQVGLINVADRGTGVQIGLINKSNALVGLQIGLVNIIRESPLQFFPVANFAF